MKKLISLLLMGATMFGAAAAMAGSYAPQKVVYHVNYGDEKRELGAMRNIQNHINAVGKENLDIRVVMHSAGYKLLERANTDPNFKQRVENLKDQGVKFNICANTLRGKKIDYKTQLYDVDQSDIVPSGVAEIAKLEQEGFAYIRP
jgi:intracellular sulfur oxidation DsrE/DsrF family protein